MNEKKNFQKLSFSRKYKEIEPKNFFFYLIFEKHKKSIFLKKMKQESAFFFPIE